MNLSNSMNVSVPASVTLARLRDLFPNCDTQRWLVYGIIGPVWTAVVTCADICVIILFMRPRMRSKTSFILTLIALVDMLSIILPTVVYLFYYTLQNDAKPIPLRICLLVYAFVDVFVDMFNGISLWLTVLLAFMRCRCLQKPFTMRCSYGFRRVLMCVAIIMILELCVHIPSFFLFDFVPIPMGKNNLTVNFIACGIRENDSFITRRTHLWMETMFDSCIPSILLLYLTCSILKCLREAKQERQSLRSSTESKGISSQTTFSRLDRESRRTSWLIFVVAALISTHELPMAFVNVHQLANFQGRKLPLVIFGCWSSLFALWQNTVYPIAFFIYACMSRRFRHEASGLCCCKSSLSVAAKTREAHVLKDRRRVPLSPCSVQKNSQKEMRCIHSNKDECDE